MKFLYTLLFIISSTTISFAQELIVKSKFEDIQFVEDVEWSADDIYCIGHSYKTKLNDGNSSYAYLVNYDINLAPKWSLKIDDETSNKIYTTLRHKDKIYALIGQGKIAGGTENLTLNLLTINLDGTIENKVSFGRTFFKPSNIVINGSHLIFGHQSKDSKSDIINYNLDTKKFTKYTSNQFYATPKKIITEKSNFVVIGNYIHPNQANVLSYRNGKYSEIPLNTKKTEYYLNSYINKNILTIVCVFPGEYGDMNDYYRYYTINLDTKTVSSVSVPYKKLGWKDIYFDTYSTGALFWTIIENREKELKYVLLDKTGKINKTLNFDRSNGNGSWEKYVIQNGMLLNANSYGIKLYKIE